MRGVANVGKVRLQEAIYGTTHVLFPRGLRIAACVPVQQNGGEQCVRSALRASVMLGVAAGLARLCTGSLRDALPLMDQNVIEVALLDGVVGSLRP